MVTILATVGWEIRLRGGFLAKIANEYIITNVSKLPKCFVIIQNYIDNHCGYMVNIYIYIYIYIERERERRVQLQTSLRIQTVQPI